MPNIPFFNYPELFEQHRDEFMPVIEDVLSRGAYIMQKDLDEFEDGLAKYLGVKHAIGTADGTLALLCALKASGLEPGDEVIVPSHTFVASISSIHYAGGVPVLCDCGPDHMMEPESVKRLITNKTKFLMPVQLNGRTANMDPILAIAKEHGLTIVEDSCQALGAKFKGKFAGTFGAAGTFSFFPAKTLGAFGDGGALITNDDDIAQRVRLLRDHGRDPVLGKVTTFGLNARLDNLHAATLSVRLAKYDSYVQQRRDIARIYNDYLQGVGDLLLPPGPDSSPDHFDVYQNYELESANRDALRDYLTSKGIGTIIQWGGNCVHQFDKLDLRFDCPYTEEMSKRFFMIPLSTVMTTDQARTVANEIRSFFGQPAI